MQVYFIEVVNFVHETNRVATLLCKDIYSLEVLSICWRSMYGRVLVTITTITLCYFIWLSYGGFIQCKQMFHSKKNIIAAPF